MSQIKILEQEGDSASDLYQKLREASDEYHNASMTAARAYDKAKRFPTDETIREAILQQEAVIEKWRHIFRRDKTLLNISANIIRRRGGNDETFASKNSSNAKAVAYGI